MFSASLGVESLVFSAWMLHTSVFGRRNTRHIKRGRVMRIRMHSLPQRSSPCSDCDSRYTVRSAVDVTPTVTVTAVGTKRFERFDVFTLVPSSALIRASAIHLTSRVEASSELDKMNSSTLCFVYCCVRIGNSGQ